MTNLNGTVTAELVDAGPKPQQPARKGSCAAFLCRETGKVGHLQLFDESSGKSLGLHTLLLLSITTHMMKRATSSENE